MALIVENGTGLASAESYASVADADSYNTARVASASWTAATTTAKEIALRQGTSYLDQRFHSRWKGTRATEAQALSWPRADVTDDDGYAVGSDEVPIALKYATIEAAIRAVSSSLDPDLTNPGIVSVSRKKVGPLEVETEYLAGNAPTPVFPVLNKLVAPLCTPSGFFERG